MLDWSIKLFRVRGIRLEVHFTFLLLLAYFGYEGWKYAGPIGVFWGCLLLLSVFVCVILHELGHSLTAMHYGVQVHRILLLPIGGMAQFDRIPREPARELAITIAGPAVNFVLFGGLLLVLGGFSIDQVATLPLNLRQLAFSLAAINLVMGVFNLIPVFPMDGGRIFRALLAIRFNYLTATRWASGIGKVLATAGACWALLAYGNYLTAALFAFIYLGGDLEYRHVLRQETLRGVRVGDLVEREFRLYPANTIYADALEAAANRPDADLVALDRDEVVSVVRADQRPKEMRPWMTQRTLGRVGERVASSLQEDWPLALLAAQIQDGARRVFPVYRLSELVGILHADGLERRLLDLHHQKHAIRRDRGRV